MDGDYGDDAREYSIKFMKELRLRSVHKDDPVPEWRVVSVLLGDTKCICTKSIQRVCHIVNKLNGNECDIGCDCVERFDVDFNPTCKLCDSPLGNKFKRALERDFICPECKRAEKKRIQEDEFNREKLIDRLGRYTLWYKGPWHEKKFKEVEKNTDWINILINVNSKYETNSLKAFKSYCHMKYDFN